MYSNAKWHKVEDTDLPLPEDTDPPSLSWGTTWRNLGKFFKEVVAILVNLLVRVKISLGISW